MGYQYLSTLWTLWTLTVCGLNNVEGGHYQVDCMPCTCTFNEHGMIVANCSYRDLKQVPAGLPGKTSELLLNNNKMHQLNQSSLAGLFNIRLLDLSHNDLEIIESGSFTGLHDLHTLLMNNNRLKASIGSIPDDIFTPLQGTLHVLDIRNNVPCHAENESYIDTALSQLLALREIRMDAISDQPLPAALGNLTNLTTLHFQPDEGYCCFSNINQEILDSLANTPLHTLIYRGCNLVNLDNDTFNILPHLRELYFEGTNLYKVLFNLAAAISTSNVSKLYMNGSYIHDKIWNFIRELKGSNVTSLMFDSNKIYNDYEKPVSLKTYLPGLEELSLGDNYLQWTTDLTYDFLFAPNLQYLNLSWQEREHFNLNQSVRKYRNRAVDKHRFALNKANYTYQRDNMKIIYPNFNEVFTMAKLNKSMVRIQNRKVRYHICGIGDLCPVPVPPSMNLMDISHNGLHLPQVPDLLIMNKNKMKTLICSYNRITMLPNRILCFNNFSMELETLDLRHNQINHMVYDLFGKCDFTSMKHFLYAGNLFGQMCSTGQKGCNFTFFLPNLQTLELSTNEISKLPPNFLYRNSALRSLDLSNNSLEQISFNFSHMEALEHLDLSYNKFTCLEIKVLKMLKNSKKAKIRLAENPLSCSCNCLETIKWIFHNQDKVEDLKITICTLKNGTKISLSYIAAIKIHLEISCTDFGWIYISLGITLAYLFITTAVTVVIRFKWELRYSMFRIQLRMGRFKVCNPEGPFLYDAFLAFHEDDLNWVRQHAITNLEDKAGLNICVHKRDFLPGNPIADNIINALNNSRKVVLLLTNSFVKSGWCQFEFKMAHSMSIDRGRNILIFVIIPALKKGLVPEEMMHILNAYTYIEWPDDPARNGHFWTRLEEAIREQEQPSIAQHHSSLIS